MRAEAENEEAFFWEQVDSLFIFAVKSHYSRIWKGLIFRIVDAGVKSRSIARLGGRRGAHEINPSCRNELVFSEASAIQDQLAESNPVMSGGEKKTKGAGVAVFFVEPGSGVGVAKGDPKFL